MKTLCNQKGFIKSRWMIFMLSILYPFTSFADINIVFDQKYQLMKISGDNTINKLTVEYKKNNGTSSFASLGDVYKLNFEQCLRNSSNTPICGPEQKIRVCFKDGICRNYSGSFSIKYVDLFVNGVYRAAFYGYGEDDSFRNAGYMISSASGGSGNDFLKGSVYRDKLYGGYGNDRLEGGGGNDYLSGGYGNDRLYGQSGNDRLNGGQGNDRLYGNSGADTLVGGSGDDCLDGGYDWKIDKITGGPDFTYDRNVFKKENQYRVVSGAYAIVNIENFTDFNSYMDSSVLSVAQFNSYANSVCP